jgi:hypothetical protein
MMNLLKVPKDSSNPIKNKFVTFKHNVLDQLIDELDCKPDNKIGKQHTERNLL